LAHRRGRIPAPDRSESAAVLVNNQPRGVREPAAHGIVARTAFRMTRMASGSAARDRLARGIQQRHPHAGHEQPSEIRAIAAETIERGHPDDEGMRDGRFAWMD
jgi:hypothetical protein